MSGAMPFALTKSSTNLSLCGSSRLSKTNALVDSCGSSSNGIESFFSSAGDVVAGLGSGGIGIVAGLALEPATPDDADDAAAAPGGRLSLVLSIVTNLTRSSIVVPSASAPAGEIVVDDDETDVWADFVVVVVVVIAD